MENEQAREWAEAQKITFSVDLVEAAKKHLNFLAEVERNRYLYEDHVLQRAIYRYNAFWLPLLAKHLDNPISTEPLVVPFDCEWIWHCHRLNPLRYKSDCLRLFGRILGNEKVISSVQATSKNTTEAIWSQIYPDEPYELDLSRLFQEEDTQKSTQNEKFTTYDLLSAVKRQMPFAFQMARPYTSDDLFLQEAEGRYKGFLHLIRTNDKKNTKCFCVPTYDVDLMWHTHQLYPNSYCKDLLKAVGKVIHHNDNVSDKSPEKILQTGFSETVKQWEETFGKRYRKAGTLYIGSSPKPVTQVPLKFSNVEVKESGLLEYCGKSIQFPSIRAVEVLLEFGEIKNLPEEYKENLIVSYSKKQPDKLFNTKRSVDLSSTLGEKQIPSFECEPTGEFLFELMSYSTSSDELKPKISLKLLGSCSFSLQEFISAGSHLSVDKWLPVKPESDLKSSEPITLHVSVSYAPPKLAPQEFRLVRSQPLSKGKHADIPTKVMDRDGKDVFSLHMRNIIEDTKDNTLHSIEVYCITDSGEKHVLAEFKGNYLSVKSSHGLLKLQNNSGTDDSLFELVGYKKVKFFRGRRLNFETIHLENQKLEQGFMTAVEFSTDYPYGKAVALIDLKMKTIKAIDEWIVLPGIALAFILSAVLSGEMNSDKGNEMEGILSKSDDCGPLGNMVKIVGVVSSGHSATECDAECGSTNCGHARVKDGIVVNGGECGECGTDCGMITCVHPGNMVKIDSFAHCVKCLNCGVLAGKNDGGNEDMVTNGNDGAKCLDGGRCLVKDEFAHCVKCLNCGVLAGKNCGNEDMVKYGNDGAKCLDGGRCLVKDEFARCSWYCRKEDVDHEDVVKNGNARDRESAQCFMCLAMAGLNEGIVVKNGNDGAKCLDGGRCLVKDEFARCSWYCRKEDFDHEDVVNNGNARDRESAQCFMCLAMAGLNEGIVA